MAGNPRENVKDKGFWDGGSSSHGRNDQSAGHTQGSPGLRKPQRVGIKTDLEFPDETKDAESDRPFRT